MSVTEVWYTPESAVVHILEVLLTEYNNCTSSNYKISTGGCVYVRISPQVWAIVSSNNSCSQQVAKKCWNLSKALRLGDQSKG